MIMPQSHWSAFAKFISGVALLRIETGRYEGLSINDRTCPFCKNCIKDEFHVLFMCPLYNELRIEEALLGVLGNRVTRAFFSGEQGNKGLKIKGTGEHRQFWGTGNQDFVFGEQGHFFRGNRYPPPGRAS